MTELPALPTPSYLSDGSLATDPWPGFDLHPIRSTPEGSPIGGLVKGGGGAWGCGETKDSLSKGRLTPHRKLASSWYKPCSPQTVCMCVTVCVCMWACECQCMCVCVCVCVCVFVWARSCIYVCVGVHVRVCVWVWAHALLCVCMCVYVCLVFMPLMQQKG